MVVSLLVVIFPLSRKMKVFGEIRTIIWFCLGISEISSLGKKRVIWPEGGE
jgi:hypothetical protein